MTVNVGVIGAGMIGTDHMRRLDRVVSGARVAAVTDIDPARAAEAAAGVGARALASDAEVVADPEVDAVLVASWGPAHAASVLAAIGAGKPVLCEKPLATTAEDCRRIMEAERAHGSRLVQVGFMRRYDTGYRAMKELIDEGAIGAPLMAHCAHRNPTVPEAYHSEMATKDTAIHEIDTLRWLLGEELATAQIIRPRRTSKRFAHLVDPQLLLFETESGARIDLEVFVNCRYGYDIRCEVVGEDGAVRLPEPQEAVLHAAGRSGSAVHQDWKGRFGAAFDAEVQSWADAVAAGRIEGPSAWDGYAAAMVGDAAVRSLETGEVVPTKVEERPDFYA